MVLGDKKRRRAATRTVTALGHMMALGSLLLSSVPTAWSQASPLTITLAGQAMLRSDLRGTDPAAVTAIRSILKGDVVFTNLEGTVAEPGQSVLVGNGFLTPPGALDALQEMGFNLLAFASNHAFDLQVTGITNTLREADRLHLVHAGTGMDLSAASAPAYLHTTAACRLGHQRARRSCRRRQG